MSRFGYFLWCAGCVPDVQRLHGGGLKEPRRFERSTRTKDDFLIGRWNLIVSPERWPR